MPPSRRPVRRGDGFLARAHDLFPPGGSPDRRPSFEIFENRSLAAAEELFAADFDRQPEAAPGIRFATTHGLPVIAPLVIFACLVVQNGKEVVELLWVDVDEDYWKLIRDDPDDR